MKLWKKPKSWLFASLVLFVFTSLSLTQRPSPQVQQAGIFQLVVAFGNYLADLIDPPKKP